MKLFFSRAHLRKQAFSPYLDWISSADPLGGVYNAPALSAHRLIYFPALRKASFSPFREINKPPRGNLRGFVNLVGLFSNQIIDGLKILATNGAVNMK